MPSGYTAILTEDREVSFNEFVWRCARGFGAMIMQRDDSMNAPPVLEEKPSDYHLKELQKAEQDLAKIQAMTDAELCVRQLKETITRKENARQAIQQKEEQRARYEKMAAAVGEWIPPSPDHDGLKNFMLTQIKESTDWDCNTKYDQNRLDEPEETLEEYKKSLIEHAEWAVQHHRNEHVKEVQRVTERNEWKRLPAESVPLPVFEREQ